MQCASHLRSLGEMIREYAMHRSDSRIPAVDPSGPLSFAGVYALRLRDVDLLESQKVVWCPTQQLVDSSKFQQMIEQRVPTTHELEQLPTSAAQVWQQIAGGTYSYNLGAMVDSQLEPPSLLTVEDNRASEIAILADKPMPNLDNSYAVHKGIGTNILYQDGRVQLVRFDNHYDLSDHPYFNRRGEHRAGLDRNDSSLGVSHQSP